MKVVVIIQARMGSTRLPGKMMMQIDSVPIIEYVVRAVKNAKRVHEVWLATTSNTEDNVLAVWAEEKRVLTYRGSGTNVLDRYYQTAKLSHADVIVRITGDCPLADPAVIDEIVGEYLNGNFDYVCNTQPPTFPDGLDVEVFSFMVLEKAWKEAELSSEQEHVTPYLWKHPELFRIKNIVHDPDWSSYRLTLDTAEDLHLIEKVIHECKKRGDDYRMNTVIDVLTLHPEWLTINSKHERNEGYQKSLNEDVS